MRFEKYNIYIKIKFVLKLVEVYPIIVFKEDSLGGWSRLKNRLTSNGLVFQGEKVPSSPAALTPALEELKRACQAEGVVLENARIPVKAITFSCLISTLENLGVIQVVGGGPSQNLSGASQAIVPPVVANGIGIPQGLAIAPVQIIEHVQEPQANNIVVGGQAPEMPPLEAVPAPQRALIAAHRNEVEFFCFCF